MNERSLSARWRNMGVVSVVCAAASPRAPPLDEPPLSSERPLDHGSWRLFLLLAMLPWEKRTGSSGPAAEPGDSLPLEGHGGRLGASLSDTAPRLAPKKRIRCNEPKESARLQGVRWLFSHMYYRMYFSKPRSYGPLARVFLTSLHTREQVRARDGRPDYIYAQHNGRRRTIW